MLLLAISGGDSFNGFSGSSLILLVAACLALAVFFVVFATLWVRSYPRLPDAGPATDDLGPEPPAIVNLMANRWKVTSSAIPATLIDLAARRVLGIDQVGHDDYVVRIRDGNQTKETLSDYERQVLDLVNDRAQGKSCPVQALDLGEPGVAAAWVKRFDKRVVDHAKKLGLARPRWRGRDLRVVAFFLAIPMLLFASAFALSHLAEGAGGSRGDEWSGTDWYYVAGITWVAILAWVGAQRDLRDTPAGLKACAAWLGVRRHYRESHAFDNAPAASVVIWERHLAYGVALGAAHEAVRDLPLVPDDPNEAWTRSTGDWRQIRVNYPERFGYGDPPLTVFLGGLVRTVFWGAITFVVLPIATSIVWDVVSAILDQPDQQRALAAFVAGVALVVAFAGLYLGIRTFAGLVRLYRGFADFGQPQVIEGEVVKNHYGRVAIDDRKHDEVSAFAATGLTTSLHRGAKARVTYTKHLHYVKQVEVLAEAPVSTSADAASDVPATARPFVAAVALGPLQQVVRQATGLEMTPTALPATDTSGLPAGLGAAIQAFTDGHGGTVAVTSVRGGGAPASMMFGLLSRRGQAVPGCGDAASWLRERDLLIRHEETVTIVHVDLPTKSPDERLTIAKTIATAVTTPAPADTSPQPVPEPS